MVHALRGVFLLAGLVLTCLLVPYSLGRLGSSSADRATLAITNIPMVPDQTLRESAGAGYMDGRPVPAGFQSPLQTRWLPQRG